MRDRKLVWLKLMLISPLQPDSPYYNLFFNPSAITGGDNGDEEENMCG